MNHRKDIIDNIILDDYILEVKNLKKYFYAQKGFRKSSRTVTKAVDDISFNIRRGETLGLVGESGCGKSTLARTVIRLYDVTEGEIIFEGAEIGRMSQRDIVPIRKNMQMVFQDPYSALNSRMTVGDIIGEPLDIHGLLNKKEKNERIYELLHRVGLSKDHGCRYPHEFSGGQRQRIGIARALAIDPKFLICDEPVSALDVSVQAQVINMLEDLQIDLGLSYMFIAHDLAMVKHISNNIGVMYLGKMVEITTSEELYRSPAHPYTQALLSSIPIPDPNKTSMRKHGTIEGEVPSPINPPSGCRFRTRCKYVKDICRSIEPELKEIAPNHKCACHLY